MTHQMFENVNPLMLMKYGIVVLILYFFYKQIKKTVKGKKSVEVEKQ